MVTYPLDIPPTPAPKAVRFIAQTVVSASRSPFTGQRQVYVHPAAWWQIQVTLPPMKRHPYGESWISFLVRLNGMEGTFQIGDPLGKNPGGTGAPKGSPHVAGAGQTGRVVQTDGWTPSTWVLSLGDWVQIGTGLYKVTNGNIVSNASGGAALEIWPPLRSSPADNTPIIFTNTVGIFKLDSNQNGWGWSEPQIEAGLTFSASEAF
jgi:hypothetical protein